MQKQQKSFNTSERNQSKQRMNHLASLSAAAAAQQQQQQHQPTATQTPAQTPTDALALKMQQLNEETWLRIGAIADSVGDKDRAIAAFDAALRHNPYSVQALTFGSSLCRQRELYPRAIELFQRLLNIDRYNGAVWAGLGHCYLMLDDLQNAYQTYQQALNYLSNPKDAKLWYGIGVLYDRYGSFDHAEAAFASVLRIDPKFDKGNEIYFRLGIIYKYQQKYSLSLDCFKYILGCPPLPLGEADVWFQIGHTHECQRDFINARAAYETGLQRNPNNAKILLQLGWLYMLVASGFQNYDQAVAYLSRAMEVDTNDAQTHYLLGRSQMAKQKFNLAYESYQQAVLRDAKNPVFWCSIGVLYFELGQHRDALDAYSRAIYLNPSIFEIWCNLGKLYESCNGQTADAIDAYTKAVELDPNNNNTKHRLAMLRAFQANAGPAPGPPEPAIHPMAQDPSTYTPGGPTGKPQPPISSSSFFPTTRSQPQPAGPQPPQYPQQPPAQQQQQPQQPQQQQQLQQQPPQPHHAMQQQQYLNDRRRSVAQPQISSNGSNLMSSQSIPSRGPSPHVSHINGNVQQPQYMQHQPPPQHTAQHQMYPQHQQIQHVQQAGQRSGLASPQQVPQIAPQQYQQSLPPQHYQQQQLQPPPLQHPQQSMPPQSQQYAPPPQQLQQQQQSQQPYQYPPQHATAPPQQTQMQATPLYHPSNAASHTADSPAVQPGSLRPTSPTAYSQPPLNASDAQQPHINPSVAPAVSISNGGAPTPNRMESVLTPTSQHAPFGANASPVGPHAPSVVESTVGSAPVAVSDAMQGVVENGVAPAIPSSATVGNPEADKMAQMEPVSGTAAPSESVPESMRKVDDDYDDDEKEEGEEEEEEGAIRNDVPTAGSGGGVAAGVDEKMGDTSGRDEEEIEEEGGVPPAQ
ncbi:hypothetical protein CcCBS67573_g05002 [Chytriomyces confervae]|uniref:Uncharacterized protein n=1 Tax=Chytriomyces confervae TaxID=246404 RepID=A0A507FBL1_9FUNG|nr:hypothetical protein CcCBS67573_g05002 [Chytriomyces confervae]